MAATTDDGESKLERRGEGMRRGSLGSELEGGSWHAMSRFTY